MTEETKRSVSRVTDSSDALSSAVRQLRPRSSHSNGAMARLQAEEQSLMNKEAELQQRAEELLAEVRDCQRALGTVRDGIKRLGQAY